MPSLNGPRQQDGSVILACRCTVNDRRAFQVLKTSANKDFTNGSDYGNRARHHRERTAESFKRYQEPLLGGRKAVPQAAQSDHNHGPHSNEFAVERRLEPYRGLIIDTMSIVSRLRARDR